MTRPTWYHKEDQQDFYSACGYPEGLFPANTTNYKFLFHNNYRRAKQTHFTADEVRYLLTNHHIDWSHWFSHPNKRFVDHIAHGQCFTAYDVFELFYWLQYHETPPAPPQLAALEDWTLDWIEANKPQLNPLTSTAPTRQPRCFTRQPSLEAAINALHRKR